MNLSGQLEQLEQAEIVRRANEVDLAYLFKHALTQETAYASLLKKARRDLHLQVAQAIEAQYSDRLEEFAALLAQHYAAAEDDAKSLEYGARAGDASARIFANSEAIALYSIAIEAGKKLRAPLAELYVKRGRVLELTGGYSEALANYLEMESQAREVGDGALELASLVARATLFSTHTPLYNMSRALEFSERALSLSRRIGDQLTEAKILWTQMLRHIYGSGDNWAGAECGEASLKILRAINPQPGIVKDRAAREQLAYTLNDMLYAYIQQGKLERGLAARLEARELWRELDNKPMLADNLAGVSIAQWSFGQAQVAITTADEAFAVAESVGNAWSMAQGRAMRGYALAELGRFRSAIAALKEADGYATTADTGGAIIAARCGLAFNCHTLGMFELGLKYAISALEGAQKHIPDWHLWPYASMIRLYLAGGDVATAQRIAIESGFDSPERKLFRAFMPGVAAVVLADAELAIARNDYSGALAIADDARAYFQGSCPNYLPDLYLLCAEAFERQDSYDQAAQVLRDALAATSQARRMQWRVLAAASEVEKTRGNASEAERLRADARAEMEFIAQDLDTEMLKSFQTLARRYLA